MDKVEKLFKKISQKDRDQIKAIIFLIANNDSETLEIKKLAGMKNFYRVRVGKYRVIFKKEKGQNIIWEVKLRN